MQNLVIEENVPLAPLTTFKVGGSARHFVRVKDSMELLEVINIASQNNWPVFILAGGSNLIVADHGFRGLVVVIEVKSLVVDGTLLTAGAATSMKELVDESIEKGLAGLEWAGGLPGTFGGAIRGNAGAFGGEMKDVVFSVKSVDIATGREIIRDAQGCQFEYRGSYFKYHKEVILEATLQLRPGVKANLRKIADDHIQFRQDRHPMEFPNAGSVFKNIPLEKVPKVHLPLFADAIKDDPFPIVPTAKILAVADLKGMKVGQAQLSEKHTNYIVNLGGATAKDIVQLIEKIKAEIKNRYQVDLEVEPELVGF